MQLRPITTLSEFRDMVHVASDVWNVADENELLSLDLVMVTARRGAIVIGGFDGERMAGFVYSLPGIKRDGRVIQWSHMLAVREPYRNTGLGRLLKLEQRRMSLEMGIDLIEWTYDPLQALNAHLNFNRLGVVASEYAIDVYPQSSSTLHRGAPTDRFVAQWHLRSPRVLERIEEKEPPAARRAVDAEYADIPVVNSTRREDGWEVCAEYDVQVDASHVWVEIPPAFTEMLTRSPERACDWRMKTRHIFTTCFARGYKAVEFVRLEAGGGRYLLRKAKDEG